MPADPLAILHRRLHAQRLASGRLGSPAEAVSWLGAMQAQEYAEAKWSIAERVTEGCTEADVEEAFAQGEILRTHLLRPTWHFVTPADIGWMLRLTAPRVHAANRYMYRRLDLTEDTLERAHEVIAGALAGDAPRTRRELQDALARSGIEADGLRLGYILMHAELEQRICSGPRRGKQHTYALFESRVPAAPEREREDALAELSLRYFVGRGPATVRDFSSWSGLTMTDAKAGLQMVEERLLTEIDDEGTTWVSAPAAGDLGPAGGAFLIGMYDELGIGYHKDLRMVLASQPPREGLLSRPIVIDGRTFGSWQRTATQRDVVIEATLFTDLGAAERSALAEVVERFGRFAELPARLEETPQ